MEQWTLKAELARRGMDMSSACVVCGVDSVIMSALISGGKTMPEFALKVAWGLGLNAEQAQVLGKPLDKTVWKPGNGLGRPRPINVDPVWYEQAEKVQNGRLEDYIWLDIPAMTAYMWESRMDLNQLFGHDAGCKATGINRIITHERRAHRARLMAEMLGIPEEVALTKCFPGLTAYRLRFEVDIRPVEEAVARAGGVAYKLARRAVAAMKKNTNATTVENQIINAIDEVRSGGVLTMRHAALLSAAVGMDMHDLCRPMVLKMVQQRRVTEE